MEFDDATACAAVHAALGLGINLIDTSPLYGESERRIGLALQEWYRLGGKRADLVLSTKTGTRTRPKDYSAGGTRRSVEESMRLLKTEYLDIVLIHDPDAGDIEPALAPGGALEALLKMKAEGAIRAIGLGVRTHEFHRRCIGTGCFDLSLTYRDYNLIDQTALDGVILPASRQNMAVFNAAVLVGGLLGNVAPKPESITYEISEPDARRAAALRDFAESRGVSLLALSLRYSLRDARITSTLIGVADTSELESDFAALSEPVPAGIWDELNQRFGLPV